MSISNPGPERRVRGAFAAIAVGVILLVAMSVIGPGSSERQTAVPVVGPKKHPMLAAIPEGPSLKAEREPSSTAPEGVAEADDTAAAVDGSHTLRLSIVDSVTLEPIELDVAATAMLVRLNGGRRAPIALSLEGEVGERAAARLYGLSIPPWATHLSIRPLEGQGYEAVLDLPLDGRDADETIEATLYAAPLRTVRVRLRAPDADYPPHAFMLFARQVPNRAGSWQSEPIWIGGDALETEFEAPRVDLSFELHPTRASLVGRFEVVTAFLPKDGGDQLEIVASRLDESDGSGLGYLSFTIPAGRLEPDASLKEEWLHLSFVSGTSVSGTLRHSPAGADFVRIPDLSTGAPLTLFSAFEGLTDAELPGGELPPSERGERVEAPTAESIRLRVRHWPGEGPTPRLEVQWREDARWISVFRLDLPAIEKGQDFCTKELSLPRLPDGLRLRVAKEVHEVTTAPGDTSVIELDFGR